MSHHLSKYIHRKLLKSISPTHFTIFNDQHQHRHCSAATVLRSRDQRQIGGDQLRLLYGSSLPLSSLFHHCNDHSHHRSHRQVSCILPHSPWLSIVQEQMLNSRPVALYSNPRVLYVNSILINSHPRMLHLNPRVVSGLENFDLQRKVFRMNCRGLCGVTDGGDSELEGNYIRGEIVESKADPKEVKRVWKIFEKVFAWKWNRRRNMERNMEAMLDDCGINLTHDLVVDVLEKFKHERFKHARGRGRPAFRFFCWAGQKTGFSHDSRTYNSMMMVLGKTRRFETMVTVLEEMGEKGLLTIETFEISMRAFAASKKGKKAVGIFHLMKKYKFKVGVDTVNCLLDILGRANLGNEAQLSFEKLKGTFTPNLQTYTILLYGWCAIKNLLEAGKMWNEMIDKGLKPDIIAYNVMLEGLLRGHESSDAINAIKLFKVMKAKGPSPDVRSYTVLIRALFKHKMMDEAIKYFEEMIDSGCNPDVAIYTYLIAHNLYMFNYRKIDKAQEFLKGMKERGCPPDQRLYNTLIKLTTKRRTSDDAVRIYKKMLENGIQPDVSTYIMMLKSYLVTENYDMGCSVWEEMNRYGCCPDDNCYILLIGGLIRLGRSIEACKYLEEMIEKGMKVPELDYDKLAADFSRAGKPDILEELAQKMKFAGKFDVSNVLAKWAEMMRKQVKIKDPDKKFVE